MSGMGERCLASTQGVNGAGKLNSVLAQPAAHAQKSTFLRILRLCEIAHARTAPTNRSQVSLVIFHIPKNDLSMIGEFQSPPLRDPFHPLV